jgi:hypothetical protein
MTARRIGSVDGKTESQRDDVRVVREADNARGGVSLWSILSGVLVALGAFVVLSSLVGGILAATGVAEGGISAEEATTAGVGAGIGIVIAQFLSYMWGGYTAGRMARGSGLVNGILVPVVAIVLVAILGAVVAGITSAATDVGASDVQKLPLPLGSLGDIGTGVGIGLLMAMLLGGAVGGWLGARWHTKLEDGERLPGRR